MTTYNIIVTPEAAKMLEAITNAEALRKISKGIDALQENPESKGGELLGSLGGYKRLIVFNKRYRVIYRIHEERKMVVIVAIGERAQQDERDVYAIAKKLIKAGLLE